MEGRRVIVKTGLLHAAVSIAVLAALASSAQAAPPPRPVASQTRANAPARAVSSRPATASRSAAASHVAIRAAAHAATSAKTADVPAFEPPPPMASLTTLAATGKALVQRQAVRARQLRSTSGFDDHEELAKAVSAMSPSRARAVEALRNEGSFELAMRAPEKIRESLAATGFLNQHDTKASGGSYNPEGRTNSEASMIGLTRAEYDRVPNAVRPKFGFLRPSPSSGLHIDESSANHYGSDVFVFKTEALREHVTFYPDNSLGRGPDGLGRRAGSAPATAWHQLVQPWSERMVLAASLDVADSGRVSTKASGPPGFKGLPYKGTDYVEVQIWKPLAVSDIARFEFGSSPPSGKFLETLRKNGVKIYQRGATEEWKGDS